MYTGITKDLQGFVHSPCAVSAGFEGRVHGRHSVAHLGPIHDASVSQAGWTPTHRNSKQQMVQMWA